MLSSTRMSDHDLLRRCGLYLCWSRVRKSNRSNTAILCSEQRRWSRSFYLGIQGWDMRHLEWLVDCRICGRLAILCFVFAWREISTRIAGTGPKGSTTPRPTICGALIGKQQIASIMSSDRERATLPRPEAFSCQFESCVTGTHRKSQSQKFSC